MRMTDPSGITNDAGFPGAARFTESYFNCTKTSSANPSDSAVYYVREVNLFHLPRHLLFFIRFRLRELMFPSFLWKPTAKSDLRISARRSVNCSEIGFIPLLQSPVFTNQLLHYEVYGFALLFLTHDIRPPQEWITSVYILQTCC